MKFFYEYARIIQDWQDIKLIKAHSRIKYLNVLMLVLSAAMFLNGGIGNITLPNFLKYTDMDIWVWAIILFLLALVQLSTLIWCKCENTYKWSNTILIISGFALLIVGCLFGFKYPPHNWQMTVYPFVGVLFSLVGRKLNKITPKPTRGTVDGKNH